MDEQNLFMIIKKTIIAILLTIVISSQLVAQNNISETPIKRPSNNFSLNSFEGATIASVNYERLFAKRKNSFLAFGFGVGFTGDLTRDGLNPDKETYLTLPHHFTFNSGKGKHFFEFGLTASFIPDNNETNYQLGPIIGYRLQPLNSNKLTARVYASVPFIATNSDIFYSPLGISIGYCL